MAEIYAEAVYVEAARGCLALIDDLSKFLGADKRAVLRQVMKSGGLTASAIESLRYRVESPPARIGHGAYLAICSAVNGLAKKALAKTERLLRDAEAGGIGLDQECWNAARDLALRADEIENRISEARRKSSDVATTMVTTQ